MAIQVSRLNEMLAYDEARPRIASPSTLMMVAQNGTSETHSLPEWGHSIEQTVQGLRENNRLSSAQKQALLSLERQQSAFLYRSQLAGVPELPHDQLVASLHEIIAKYKQKLYPGRDPLTPFDREQIGEVCRLYPLVAEKWIRRDVAGKAADPWVEQFVKFCLRAPGASGRSALHWVKIFVEYPNEVDQLMKAFLEKRLGATDPSLLALRAREDGVEALCLQVDGHWVECQGDKKGKRLSLRNRITPGAPPCELTLQNIYDQMRKKTSEYGKIEVFQEGGILYWKSLLNADPQKGEEEFSVDQPGWLGRLPVWRTMTEAELLQFFEGRVNLHWAGVPHRDRFAIAMCATRAKASREISDTHGFLYVIIPTDERRFKIIPVGFQPTSLPRNQCDKLDQLEKSSDCQLHLPDESPVRSERQRYGELHSINQQELLLLEGNLTHFVQRARRGEKYFQPTATNCAARVQKLFDRVIGRRFYEGFKQIAKRCSDSEFAQQVDEWVKKGVKKADQNALSQVSGRVAERLTSQKNAAEIVRLLQVCFQAIQLVATPHRLPWNPPQERELRLQVDQALLTSEGASHLKSSLETMIRLGFESQQFYRMSIWDAEVGNPVLGFLFRAISSVPWQWLRGVLIRTLMFVLGSFRGRTHLKKDGVTKKTVRVWNHFDHGAFLPLPAQIFYRPAKIQEILKKIPSFSGQVQAG